MEYTYDAWGNILTVTGGMANTLGKANPLRYRGYVYDDETRLYYLQSRYYDPQLGRFINSDVYASTGQGFIGNNMFAYCGNNPVIRIDASGDFFNTVCGALVGGVVSVITRGDTESAGDAFLRGMATGALAGAGLDICVATGGVGGLLIAGALGAGAAMIDTAWEAHNNGGSASTGGILLSGVVGSGLNVLFGASGRELANATGNTIKSVGAAIVSNTARSVTNRTGKFVLRKAIVATAENLATSTVQSGFGKIFTIVDSKMLEAFEK